MSTKTVDTGLDFVPVKKNARRPGGVMGSVRDFFASLGEGISAAHDYQRLTARGVPHQKAVEIVFRDHFANHR